MFSLVPRSLLEPCWRSAGLQLGHSYVPAWLQSPAALNFGCSLILWLDLGPVTSLWTYLVITGPGPDLWIDFLGFTLDLPHCCGITL